MNATKAVGAEYLATVLLIGAAGFQGRTTLVRIASPLARITAATLVFVLLALVSDSRSWGKVAAAFGGLVTLGALFSARDTISWATSLITGEKPAQQQGSGSGRLGPGRFIPESGPLSETEGVLQA